MGGNGMCATCGHVRSDHRFEKHNTPCFHAGEIIDLPRPVVNWCACQNYVSDEYVSATGSLRPT